MGPLNSLRIRIDRLAQDRNLRRILASAAVVLVGTDIEDMPDE